MVTKSLLALFILAICASRSTFVSGQAIANAYATTNASRFVNAPGTPYIAQVFYNADATTTLQLYASYNLSAAAVFDFSEGQVFTPRRVTLPWPFCAVRVSITAEAPAACVGGKLVYAYFRIPASTAISNNGSVLNGATQSLIAGVVVPPLDPGGAASATGTLTYVPAVTCPTNASNFLVNITFTGMRDVADSVPVAYTDDASNTTQYAVTYGLGCTAVLRPVTSPVINLNPVVIPICKSGIPANASFDPLAYEAMYGVGFQGPVNVPIGRIVYQLRLDNAQPGIYSIFASIFQNLNPVIPLFDLHFVSFDQIMYLTGPLNDTAPFHFFGCTATEQLVIVFPDVGICPSLGFNYYESQLGYLEPCNCAGSVPNLYCPSGDIFPVETLFNRSAISYFTSNSTVNAFPICGIIIATNSNSTTPVPNQVFSVVSASFGGAGVLVYSWRFINTPQSSAQILNGSTSSSATAIVFFPGSYTVQLAVTGSSNGYTTVCERTFTSASGVPQICYTPPAVIVVITVGQMYPINAGCSFNPLAEPMFFTWSAFSYYNVTVFPFTVGPNTGAVTTVTGITPGSGIVFLNVTNAATTVGVAIYFYVTPLPPPPGSPIAPFAIPFAPGTNCFIPTAPVFVPFIPPSQLPPLGTLPVAPGSPMTLNPSGSSPFSGIPFALQESTVITLSVLIVVGGVACLVLIPLIESVRRPRRDDLIKNFKVV